MIDDIRLAEEKLQQARTWDAIKELERLQESEVIRMVMDGKFTPKEIDSAFRKMKAQIVKLENQHFADQAEIMRLKRFTELLTMPEVEK